MESEPIRFFVEELQPLMDRMRQAVGAFVKCGPEGIAPMPNASIAVATVLENVRLGAGDEILTTTHEYPACLNSVRRAAARWGARVVYAEVPFPCPGPEAVFDSIMSGLSARTKLALISHVTSPSGLVLPVERLVRELEGAGVACLIDGAHAPGMVAWLDVGALGASYYAANCHKWVCSPKGSAFLHVREDRREGFRPLALSNHAEAARPGRAQFLTEFDYVGTQDYTALLAIPDALACMGSMTPGGWPDVMARNHAMAVGAREHLCSALGAAAPAPAAMIGSTATIILPPHDAERHARLMKRPTRYHDALQDALVDRWRIQVPVWGVAGRPQRFLRVSAQLYNSPAQYGYLAHAVAHELGVERTL